MDWKDKLGALKSVLPEGEEQIIEEKEAESSLQKEPLRIELDRRRGKLATLIYNFEGNEDELKELAKTLRVKCGTGGSARGGEILIQGDFRKKIAELLKELGYNVRRINF